jgi:DNA polymerase III delta subunit
MAAELKPSMRIVLLHGKERFLLEEGTRRLVEVLKTEYGDVERFDIAGATAALSDVLDELRTFGLFGPHKLVVLEDADAFLKGGRAGGDDDEGGEEEGEEVPDKGRGGGKEGAARRRAMEEYAAGPVAQSTLLMRASGWNKGKLDALIEKTGGAIVKCDPVKDPAGWCVRECERRHKARIDREAAVLLVDRAGGDLLRLDAELEKLAVYAASGTIRRDDVELLVGGGREEKAWALQSAIVSGSAAQALAKIDQVLELDRNLVVLLNWAVTDLLRRLHVMAQLLRQGVRLESRRGELRLFGPEGDRMVALARAGPGRYARLLREAIESDHRTKSGRGEARRNLEVLTLRVADSMRV